MEKNIHMAQRYTSWYQKILKYYTYPCKAALHTDALRSNVQKQIGDGGVVGFVL